jgi:hypothetical protein
MYTFLKIDFYQIFIAYFPNNKFINLQIFNTHESYNI